MRILKWWNTRRRRWTRLLRAVHGLVGALMAVEPKITTAAQALADNHSKIGDRSSSLAERQEAAEACAVAIGSLHAETTALDERLQEVLAAGDDLL